MKRAISPALMVVAATTAACGSSGNVSGPTVGPSPTDQTVPLNSNQALPNVNAAAPNVNEPLGNTQQSPPNPNQIPISSGAATSTDACSILCANIDPRCARDCADGCTSFNTFLAACPDVIAYLNCLVATGLTCDNGNVKIHQAACTEELTAAAPCVESVQRNRDQTSSMAPPAIARASDGGP